MYKRQVSIDAVKKFVADLDLKAEDRYVPEKTVQSVSYTHLDVYKRQVFESSSPSPPTSSIAETRAE